MSLPRSIAVVDIGKTNAKVVLIDRSTGAEIEARTAPNEAGAGGPYPHPDVGRLAEFLYQGLADLHRAHRFDAIAVVGHGAAGAFLSVDQTGDGLALPVLDYEHDGPDELSAEYDAVRPDFSEAMSPRLPGGLNLGAQIFWQQRRFPDAVAQASAYVTYPQYWAWRLTGVAANETCSIGCHTDLWSPVAQDWSSMVRRLGWSGLFAPLRRAYDQLGPVRADLAARLGLPADLPVACGIHDSSASLLPHLAAQQAPFTLVSTGTWTIVMAIGGALDGLDPSRDTLAFMTPDGRPIPSARFMGGRDFELLAGDDAPEPTSADVDKVLTRQIMALPSFVPGVGPFPARTGEWTQPADTLPRGERTAAASLYLALVTSVSMNLAGAGGTTLIEGPLARNRLFCEALATMTGRSVVPTEGVSGPARGAALLFGPETGYPAPSVDPVAPLVHPALSGYVESWRARVADAP